MTTKQDLTITLTNDEALVLFEFVTKINKAENEKLFSHQAEQRVLWDIEALLEARLTETFDANYDSLLDQARKQVQDKP